MTTPGTSTAQTINLTNLGTAALNINPSDWRLSGANAGSFFIASNGCGATLAVGATCVLAVNFTPAAFDYGTYTANLIVQDDSGGVAPIGGAPSYLPQTLLLIGLTGNPPPQTSSFSLQNATFPSEPIGNSATQTVTLVLNDASNVQSITTATGSEFSVGTYAPCTGPAATTCNVPSPLHQQASAHVTARSSSPILKQASMCLIRYR